MTDPSAARRVLVSGPMWRAGRRSASGWAADPARQRDQVKVEADRLVFLGAGTVVRPAVA